MEEEAKEDHLRQINISLQQIWLMGLVCTVLLVIGVAALLFR